MNKVPLPSNQPSKYTCIMQLYYGLEKTLTPFDVPYLTCVSFLITQLLRLRKLSLAFLLSVKNHACPVLFLPTRLRCE